MAVVLRSCEAANGSTHMRERIRARLRVFQVDAVQNIGFAVNRTKFKFSGAGRLNSGSYYRSINEDIRAGLAKYVDQSANFIRQVAPGSSAEYVDELWDAAHKLKQEIMANKNELRAESGVALDELIERKVKDFELGYVEGKDIEG
jgi:hypothetical protein